MEAGAGSLSPDDHLPTWADECWTAEARTGSSSWPTGLCRGGREAKMGRTVGHGELIELVWGGT